MQVDELNSREFISGTGRIRTVNAISILIL